MLPVFFAGLLFAVEAKSVVFSVNGMETAFMLFFLSWTFYLMTRDKFNWLQIGVAWGGMMWTRPDSCVYIAVLSMAFYVFRRNSSRDFALSIVKAAAVTTVFYLPWFIWAWWYYGSPVPNTVLAKEGMFGSSNLLDVLFRTVYHFPRVLSWVYAPVYPHFQGWNPIVYLFSGTAGIFAAVYWMLPWAGNDRIGRTASCCFFFIAVYLSYMPFPYPWYFPPAAMLGIIVFARGTFMLAGHFKKPENRSAVPVLALSGCFLVMTVTVLLTSYEMMLQQKYIEDGTRKKIGEWLNKNSARNDRIYVEALGYIGYFSDRKILDWPGLVSPEVVRAVKKEKLDYTTVIERLRPEWVVARIFDHWNLVTRSGYFRDNYDVAIVFDSLNDLENLGYIPGEYYLLYDSCYYISRKKSADGVPVKEQASPPAQQNNVK
ncbi:MAG: hypothetical protein WAX69_10585 [Victivallales bacterium]